MDSILKDIENKFSRILLILSIVSLIVVTPVFAWLTSSKKYSRTDDLIIDMPPIIYIKNDKMQNITSFNLDGLKVGEEYNTLFCVAPAKINVVDSFFLGLVYTENMGMDMKLYPVHSITENPVLGQESQMRNIKLNDDENGNDFYFNYLKTQDSGVPKIDDTTYSHKITYGNWENETKNPEDISLNTGIFKSYNGLRFSKASKDAKDLVIDKLNDTGRYRFFVLNITWNIDQTNIQNIKETDIIYIISKGIREEIN